MTPRRIQRRRTRGWRMPEGAVYVGRPTPYGNPLIPDRDLDVQTAVRLFRDIITAQPNRYAPLLEQLRGHDLACWCPLDAPCHADVLLDLANRPARPCGLTPHDDPRLLGELDGHPWCPVCGWPRTHTEPVPELLGITEALDLLDRAAP